MGGVSEGCHSGHHKVSVLAVIFVPLFVINRKERMWFKTIAYRYCCDIFVSGCVQLLEWGNPLRTVCVRPMFPLFTTLCFCFRICTAVGVGESPEDSLCVANVPSTYNSLFLFQDMYSCWSGGIP